MAEKLLRDKLGYKTGQRVLLLDLPSGMADPFDGVDHEAARAAAAKPDHRKFDLVLAFIQNQAALAVTAPVVTAAVTDDSKLWLAYPKKTGKIATDLTRDNGWGAMLAAGFIVVAIAAVDETWSAVRFRPKRLVKSIQYS